MNIQWYPGHMTKTRRMMEEDIKLVDAVCEVVDARIPTSSRNPDLERMLGGKPRLVVLNRADQANPQVTKLWRKAIPGSIETVCCRTGGVKEFVPAVKTLLADKLAGYAEKGQSGRGLRLMICGVPNVGKSTLINALAGRKAAKTEDRPGVTRGKQWVTVGGGMAVLDTPGILWPKFDSEKIGLNLAYTGAIRDQTVDIETLAFHFLEDIIKIDPSGITERYKISTTDTEISGPGLLEMAARKRGFLRPGGLPDLERMAIILMDEFRAGKLGRISLEKP